MKLWSISNLITIVGLIFTIIGIIIRSTAEFSWKANFTHVIKFKKSK